mmetsp:Transcript_13538/g.26855  ORF Transcript_13538/g.26855 Transcript_13538/m.26855 type:complete len:211 (-) Transcript_13538:986-1618(-)
MTHAALHSSSSQLQAGLLFFLLLLTHELTFANQIKTQTFLLPPTSSFTDWSCDDGITLYFPLSLSLLKSLTQAVPLLPFSPTPFVHLLPPSQRSQVLEEDQELHHPGDLQGLLSVHELLELCHHRIVPLVLSRLSPPEALHDVVRLLEFIVGQPLLQLLSQGIGVVLVSSSLLQFDFGHSCCRSAGIVIIILQASPGSPSAGPSRGHLHW